MSIIQLPEDLWRRVEDAATQQGESVTTLVQELLEEYLEELEDIAEAREILGRIERGEEETIPWEQAKAELAEWDTKLTAEHRMIWLCSASFALSAAQILLPG